MYNECTSMTTLHLISNNPGDSTIEVPKYKFSRVLTRDYDIWTKFIIGSGCFENDKDELHKWMIRTSIAGYLVKDKDKLIASASLSLRGGFPTVVNLYVTPEYRRKRIGWTLSNMCLLRAKANTYFEVHAYIDSDNIPALEMFHKLDFKEIVHV